LNEEIREIAIQFKEQCPNRLCDCHKYPPEQQPALHESAQQVLEEYETD
jgi:hypothetical protein